MFQAPNYTQTPNDFFDEIAKTLKEGELRIMLCLMRQTFGWRKRWDRISLTQIAEKTGMQKPSVVRSLRTLILKKLVQKHKEGPKGAEICWYTLEVDGVDEEPKIEDEFSPVPNNYYQSPKEPSSYEKSSNSNNSYRYPKETTPGILKIPTKETIPKERRKERERESEPSVRPPAIKIKNFIYKRVKMTEEQHKSLVDDFGEAKIKEMMDRVDEYADLNRKRFNQYMCHSTVIRKWIREEKPAKPTYQKQNDLSRHQGLTKDTSPSHPSRSLDFSEED